MSKPLYELCRDRHAATGTIGWLAPMPPGYTGAHASVRICPREQCQRSANRWVREHTGHDGIYRTFEQARSERQHAAAGGAS